MRSKVKDRNQGSSPFRQAGMSLSFVTGSCRQRVLSVKDKKPSGLILFWEPEEPCGKAGTLEGFSS